MYATIRTYAGGADFADALAENQDGIRDVIATIGGFRGYYHAWRFRFGRRRLWRFPRSRRGAERKRGGPRSCFGCADSFPHSPSP